MPIRMQGDADDTEFRRSADVTESAGVEHDCREELRCCLNRQFLLLRSGVTSVAEANFVTDSEAKANFDTDSVAVANFFTDSIAARG